MSISSATSGLGSFALNDDEIEAYNTEIEAYEKSIGDIGGIADLGAIRARMEEMGRFGDDALAHVETGELVVPKPLLDKMPELKESILGHLRDMGVEDPERYIVGDGSNAINPETGALEFFFKSIFRGIKKAVKSVGKFLKKAAPTIITIAGAALLGPAGLGLSTIAAGAISSGIGTLVGGGSIKDALFSAAIGGATPFLAPSIGSVAAGALGGMARSAVGGGDMEDILLGGAMGAGGAALGKVAGPSVNRMLGGTSTGVGGLQDLTADFDKTSDFFTTASSDGLGAALQPSLAEFDTTFGTDFATPGTKGFSGAPVTPAPSPKTIKLTNAASGQVQEANLGSPIEPRFNPNVSAVNNAGMLFDAAAQPDANTGAMLFDASLPQNQLQPVLNQASPTVSVDSGNTNIDPDTGFFGRNFPETTKSVVGAFDDPVGFLSGAETQTSAEQAVATGELAGKIAPEIRAKNPTLSPAAVQKLALDAAKQQVADAQPGFFGKNRGLLLAGGIAGAAALPSLMEVPEMEEPDLIEKISPEERAAMVAANRLPPGALTPRVTSPRQTRVATAIGSQGFNQSLRDRFPELFSAPLAAAEGGEVFPRRTGGIMPNEGTPGKDSVKALVMPGEFIFTTNAVKGAGNGDLQQGINNMYGVMRNLEARGARMA
jgi:hypothetical protein